MTTTVGNALGTLAVGADSTIIGAPVAVVLNVAEGVVDVATELAKGNVSGALGEAAETVTKSIVSAAPIELFNLGSYAVTGKSISAHAGEAAKKQVSSMFGGGKAEDAASEKGGDAAAMKDYLAKENSEDSKSMMEAFLASLESRKPRAPLPPELRDAEAALVNFDTRNFECENTEGLGGGRGCAAGTAKAKSAQMDLM